MDQQGNQKKNQKLPQGKGNRRFNLPKSVGRSQILGRTHGCAPGAGSRRSPVRCRRLWAPAGRLLSLSPLPYPGPGPRFSNLSRSWDHLETLIKAPPAHSELGGLGGTPTFAFLTSSQVLLLAQGSHFGNHWPSLSQPWLPMRLTGGRAASQLNQMPLGQGLGRQFPR